MSYQSIAYIPKLYSSLRQDIKKIKHKKTKKNQVMRHKRYCLYTPLKKTIIHMKKVTHRECKANIKKEEKKGQQTPSTRTGIIIPQEDIFHENRIIVFIQKREFVIRECCVPTKKLNKETPSTYSKKKKKKKKKRIQ